MLWNLLESISQAGAYLHTHKIPHGDIRAHNIFIQEREERSLYKLFDLSATGQKKT